MDLETFFDTYDSNAEVVRPAVNHKEPTSTVNDIIISNVDFWWKLLPANKMIYEDSTAFNILSAYFFSKKNGPVFEVNISGNYGPEVDSKTMLNLLVTEINLPFNIVFVKNSDDSLKKESCFLEYQIVYNEGFLKLYTYDDSVVVSAYGSQELTNKITKYLQRVLVNEPMTGTIYMMVTGPRGLEFHSVGLAGCSLERENYAPDVLEAFDRMKTELTSTNPKGRLNIVDGAPGGGKSFLIRGLLEEVKGGCFVVVPAHYITALSEPSAIAALTKFKRDNGNKPIILIAEDADQCLIKREEGHVSAVSAVLNIGDGLMGAVWDIRIIATTNVPWIDLDPAIKRPGRLNTTINIKELDVDQANDVYQRLTSGTERPFNKPKLLAEIYQLAKDSEWKTTEAKKVNKMGFGA